MALWETSVYKVDSYTKSQHLAMEELPKCRPPQTLELLRKNNLTRSVFLSLGNLFCYSTFLAVPEELGFFLISVSGEDRATRYSEVKTGCRLPLVQLACEQTCSCDLVPYSPFPFPGVRAETTPCRWVSTADGWALWMCALHCQSGKGEISPCPAAIFSLDHPPLVPFEFG